MNLMRFLLQSSRRTVIVATIAGAVAGATGIGLIALIQIELARESPAPVSMVWAFAALCVISAIARVIGQIGMVRLGQRAVSDLSLQIVRRALKLPLRAFEAIDTSGLLAVLTEDIILIANALVGIPHLCINAPILIACLIYIGWLSPLIFLCGVLVAVPAIAISVILSSMSVRKLRQARARQDVLVGHFRTLIGGFRELKLHRGRREAYLARSLEPTMASVRRDMVRRPYGLRGYRRLEPARVFRFHRCLALCHRSNRADRAADARFRRPHRSLSDEPARHHSHLAADSRTGAGIAPKGSGVDPDAGTTC